MKNESSTHQPTMPPTGPKVLSNAPKPTNPRFMQSLPQPPQLQQSSLNMQAMVNNSRKSKPNAPPKASKTMALYSPHSLPQRPTHMPSKANGPQPMTLQQSIISIPQFQPAIFLTVHSTRMYTRLRNRWDQRPQNSDLSNCEYEPTMVYISQSNNSHILRNY